MIKMSYLKTCSALVHADLMIFRQSFLDKVLDLTIWVVLTIMVTAYIMPYFGLSQDFGPFQFGGVLAATGLFEVFPSVFDLVADLEGDRVINYGLTLPIPSWMALMSKSVYLAITYFILSLCMLPVGKLCLWNQLDLTQVAYFKLLLAIILQSIFYSCFVLWVAGLIANLSKLSSVWARFIFPMWFMGGFQFSWMSLHTIMPMLAYVDLLNPMIYVTEATRVALLGQTGYLPYGICMITLCAFSILCAWHAVRRLKKRLDFV